MKLSQLHGKKLAIVVVLDERREVVFGFASYEPDLLVGNVLRIQGVEEESSEPERDVDLIINELEWDGNVERDVQYGCDYCLVLNAPAA